MPTLSKAAQKMMKMYGHYKCSKPRKAFRVVITTMSGLAHHNKLYVKAFLEGVNEGDCYRHADGTVTTRRCHWVKAVATTDKSMGIVGMLYFTSSPDPIGSIVDHTYGGDDALTVEALDIMSDGMYGSERAWLCMDEDRHDGEECTCHHHPSWNGISWQ